MRAMPPEELFNIIYEITSEPFVVPRGTSPPNHLNDKEEPLIDIDVGITGDIP